jgi:DNA-binding NarL/FixJ family response regulator
VITVLVIDDQSVVRTGLRTMLEAEPDIEVVADASYGETGIAAALDHDPDVVLVDIRMPGIDGIETTQRLKRRGVRGGICDLPTMALTICSTTHLMRARTASC